MNGAGTEDSMAPRRAIVAGFRAVVGACFHGISANGVVAHGVVSPSFFAFGLIAFTSVALGQSPPLDLRLSTDAGGAAPLALRPLESWKAPPPFAPGALAVDGLGRLFVLDSSRGLIARLNEDGTLLEFGAGEQGGARFAQITRLYARSGPDLYALDPSQSTLYQFDWNGHLVDRLTYRMAEEDDLGFVDPADFALTKSGELLVLDRAGGRLLLFDRFGEFVTDLGRGRVGASRLQGPTRLDLDEEGEIFVLDPPARVVHRLSRQGEARASWRYGEGLPNSAAKGAQLAVTSWKQIVVAADNASWVRIFGPDGVLLLHAEVGEADQPRVNDLVAGPDSLLHFARPETGELRRLKLEYPEALRPTESPR